MSCSRLDTAAIFMLTILSTGISIYASETIPPRLYLELIWLYVYHLTYVRHVIEEEEQILRLYKHKWQNNLELLLSDLSHLS